jgi:catechol 2,3-dioxygenase-like lactoylglutathione lyase family enzyme
MSSPRIHHVALLVADLDAAIERWSAATGYTFSPVGHYCTDHYVDKSNPVPHHHDARIAFSLEGPPHIELMEFTGTGTHSASQGEGFHHLGFMDYPTVEGRLAELSEMGFDNDGMALHEDGRILLFFTEKADLNGMRLEYVAELPQPIVKDDGSKPHLDDRGFPSLWPPQPVPPVSRA